MSNTPPIAGVQQKATRPAPKLPAHLKANLNGKPAEAAPAAAAPTAQPAAAATAAPAAPKISGEKKAIEIVTADGKPKPKYSQPVSTPRKAPEPGTPAAEALKKITEIRAKGYKLAGSDSMSLAPKEGAAAAESPKAAPAKAAASPAPATAAPAKSELPSIKERYAAKGATEAAAKASENISAATTPSTATATPSKDIVPASKAQAVQPVQNILNETAKTISQAIGAGHGIHFHIHAPIHMHIYNTPKSNL